MLLKSCLVPVRKDFPQYQFCNVGARDGSASPDARHSTDFLLQVGTELYPVEVKYGENTKSRSLTRLLEQNPKRIGIRYSMRNLSMDGAILNIPIPLVCVTNRLIEAIAT